MIDQLKWDRGYWMDETGCAHRTKADYLETEMLDLCGCGNPGEVREYVRQELEKLADNTYPKYEDLPAMFFIYWADHKEYAEHGATVRCSWLTAKGKELLADLQTVAAMEKAEDA